jgi:hypothetical protein
MEYQASDYASREDLETAITNNLGKTTDRKDASIVGTTAELLKVQLSHGQSVWGVAVVADDYQIPPVVDKPQRGEVHKSSLTYNDQKHESSNRGESK